MTRRERRIIPVVVVTVAALTACTGTGTGASERPSEVLAERTVQPILEELPTKPSAVAPSDRLAEGLVPPTNRWFTGLVFGDEPQPVFPSPLSFGLTESGFEFGVPTVTSVPGLIAGPFTPDVRLDVGAEQRVTRYDEVSVTLTGVDDGTEIGRTTIARGSPTVSYAALVEHAITLSLPFESEGDGLFTAEKGEVGYALLAPDATLDASGTELTLPEGANAVFFTPPPGSTAADLVDSVAPITEVSTTYSMSDDRATTTLTYRTDDGRPTLLGAQPHQRSGLDESMDCELGNYATVRGAMELCVGTSLSWSVASVEPAAALDLSALDEAERGEVLEAARAELIDESALPADTYFGGKALARLATILELARDLEDQALTTQVQDVLSEQLRKWTEPDGCERREERCFVYDPVVRGVVGLAPSFGSDQFNDHHFHYGYFLYAAAIASEGDEELRDAVAPVLTVVAADIASGQAGDALPVRRAFDPYTGHSYASGFSPFADGNNQESSSEAVSAWNGLALWAKAVGDEALEEQARWLLSAEAASALEYWVGFDTEIEPFRSYDRSVVGIVWDGKTDYATWFSPERSAVLGIQLVPMSPVAAYLGGDPERILENLAEVGEPGQFADYLLMYRALAGPQEAAAALEEARLLPEDRIDDGNSRAYLLAWIMSQMR